MMDDLSVGHQNIDTWEVLRKELREKFLPHNTVWMTKESLRKFKQTRSIREYDKQFSSLYLTLQAYLRMTSFSTFL